MTLGLVCWYEVAGGTRRRTDMVADVKELGLPELRLPATLRPVDAFRAATSGESTTLSTEEGLVDFRVRETEHSGDQVKRALSRQVRPMRGRHKPEVTQVGEAVFYRRSRSQTSRVVGGEKVRFSLNRRYLTGPEIDHLTAFYERLHVRYQEFCVSLSPQALRAMVRDTLQDHEAVPLKRGVYYAPVQRQALVEALTELVGRFEGSGNLMHWVPLEDTPRQREMLRTAVQDDVLTKGEYLARDALDQSKRGGWPLRYAQLINTMDWYHPDYLPDRAYDLAHHARDTYNTHWNKEVR